MINSPRLRTDAQSFLNITIPRNDNGKGYVCYSHPARVERFQPQGRSTTQDYEGAEDLDIRPASEQELVQAGRVFAKAGTPMHVIFSADASNWNPNTTIKIVVQDPLGSNLVAKVINRGSATNAVLESKANENGFHTLLVQAANTPSQHKLLAYKLRINYTAPQV